eukprot:gene12607-biopygen5205
MPGGTGGWGQCDWHPLQHGTHDSLADRESPPPVTGSHQFTSRQAAHSRQRTARSARQNAPGSAQQAVHGRQRGACSTRQAAHGRQRAAGSARQAGAAGSARPAAHGQQRTADSARPAAHGQQSTAGSARQAAHGRQRAACSALHAGEEPPVYYCTQWAGDAAPSCAHTSLVRASWARGVGRLPHAGLPADVEPWPSPREGDAVRGEEPAPPPTSHRRRITDSF